MANFHTLKLAYCRQRFFRQFAICTLLPFLFCSNLISAKPEHHVLNPGFELTGECLGDWDSELCASGFHAAQSEADNVSVSLSVDSTENRFIAIELLNSKKSELTRGSIELKVENLIPDTEYIFSTWIKTKEMRGHSGLLITAPNDNETAIQEIASVAGPSGTSTWQKMSLLFRTPKSVSFVHFNGFAATSRSFCQIQNCGSIQLDNWLIQRTGTSEDLPKLKNLSNPCGDSSFLNIFTRNCQPLQRNYGYSKENTNYQNVTDLACEEANAKRINLEISKLSKHGGTLKIAPCKIMLDREIDLASNVIVQGSGVGQTTFTQGFDPDIKAETLIRVEGTSENPVKNVVLRDFTVQGPGPIPLNLNNIQGKYVDNFLIERIESRNAGKSGVTFRRSKNITIRYVTIYGSTQWHGISTKDCYIGAWFDGDDSDQLISRKECSQGVRGFWTEGVTIHSNATYLNKGLGINSHASLVEIAGNLMDSNGSAAKFTEPASNIFVHHNQFSNSSREGLKIASHKLADDTLTPNSHLYLRNQFINNGSYGVRIHERARNVLFKDNVYRKNKMDNKLRIKPGGRRFPRIYICEEDEVSKDGIDGPKTAILFPDLTDSRCRDN